MATKIVTNVTTGETWEEELTAEEMAWQPSDSQIAAQDLEYLRMIRNSKLQMSDWTQGSDSPLSSDKKTEWANYRTSLRDITNTYKSINANGFSWPTEPS